MELLAKASGFDRSEQEHAFMAGMFSLLGILFGLPLAGILNPLHLNESLASAVLHHEGELGRLLQAVESSECADETRLIDLLGGLNLSIADYNLLSLDAHRWMLGVINDHQDAVHA
jgi:EAL and modified HD-GYP domain-containing signal transduction protein